MKTPFYIVAFLLFANLGFADDKNQVVIVAAGDQQQTDRARDQNAGARRARKLADLQKWASDNILLADRDIQLRTALATKLYQEKGNRPFTAREWQVFDQNTKWAIILGCPQAIPAELLDR
jgi:hypothetical protein